MRQKIEQLGQIDDKIYDWMLVDEPEPLDDIELNFDVIPNEAEFLKQIAEELKVREKIEEEREKEKEKKSNMNNNGMKTPKNKDK